MSNDITCDIATIHPARPDRFADGTVHQVMARLRREAPVHYTKESPFGAYWSIANYKDIVEIEALPNLYSSEMERGGISLIDEDFLGKPDTVDSNPQEMFIAMDPPRHTEKRRVVTPAFTPSEIARLADSIRERTAHRLDSLPRGEVFDWTREVAIDLTTDMLAILFDFPWDERHKLPIWSDAITSLDLMQNHPEERQAALVEMATRFFQLWQERADAPPAQDLLSMMIHSSALGKMEPGEFVGNMALLVVGGNDTTRNTMSGLADAVTRWPDQWERIMADESLILNATSEIIRWQCPVAHMRRTVTEDHEFRGHQFKEGDKVVMWYISGNRDETVFENGELFLPDRENARRHLSFGYGVHRCLGARLAELQISTLISEMAKRKLRLEVAGEIVRDAHPFINMIKTAPVRIVSG